MAARQSSDLARAHEAMAQLAQAYWFPLYSFVRRQGNSPEDAEDLTQEFIARLLERHFLDQVDPGRGRFRWFLMACMRHFLSNEYDRRKAQKRGGRKVVSFDAMTAEARYRAEPATSLTPEKLFDRSWALELLGRALERLKDQYIRSGHLEVYEALKHTLQGDSNAPTYATIGRRLEMNPVAVKVAACRLRTRYRELLRDELAQTVCSEADLDSELNDLLQSL